MVYTRWKCDRFLVYAQKWVWHDYGHVGGLMIATAVLNWKHTAYTSEETERQNAYCGGYPWWRDPIARRNEQKYKALIRDNSVDIADPKWTGVPKEQLHLQ